MARLTSSSRAGWGRSRVLLSLHSDGTNYAAAIGAAEMHRRSREPLPLSLTSAVLDGIFAWVFPELAIMRIESLLETVLYVDNMARAATFFEDVVGLTLMERGERAVAFGVGRQGVLLIFKRGACLQDRPAPAGIVPGHDGTGPIHMAFAIAAENYEPWLAHLKARGVKLRGEMSWQRGGRSIYFEDPDGHVLELATPGLWPNY